jgi:hypothetical protein
MQFALIYIVLYINSFYTFRERKADTFFLDVCFVVQLMDDLILTFFIFYETSSLGRTATQRENQSRLTCFLIKCLQAVKKLRSTSKQT